MVVVVVISGPSQTTNQWFEDLKSAKYSATSLQGTQLEGKFASKKNDISNKFLEYFFQFLKLQFPTKILFIDRPIGGEVMNIIFLHERCDRIYDVPRSSSIPLGCPIHDDTSERIWTRRFGTLLICYHKRQLPPSWWVKRRPRASNGNGNWNQQNKGKPISCSAANFVKSFSQLSFFSLVEIPGLTILDRFSKRSENSTFDD